VEVQTGIDPYIVEVAAPGPAYSAGLQAEDVITEINGVNMLDGTQTTLFDTIGNWKEGDAPLKMTVRRGEETFETEMTPFWDEEEGKMRIGVIIGGKVLTETQPVSFLEGIQYSWQLCVNVSGTIRNLVKRLVTTGQGLEDTAGPVGIISEVSQRVQRNGIKEFISLLAMLSINLGLMNLLPIPGLDGSRLVFGLVEIVRRKPVPAEKEAMVHMAGMVLLFGFILFVTYRDIVKLF
jgi:regulator of sigma E protease